MNLLTLYSLDFSGRTYTTKLSATSSYTRSQITARFVASDSDEFYYSSLAHLAGLSYSWPLGYVATSQASRRNNALFSSSWGGATTFEAPDGSEVYHLDFNFLAEALSEETWNLEDAAEITVDLFDNFL